MESYIFGTPKLDMSSPSFSRRLINNSPKSIRDASLLTLCYAFANRRLLSSTRIIPAVTTFFGACSLTIMGIGMLYVEGVRVVKYRKDAE